MVHYDKIGCKIGCVLLIRVELEIVKVILNKYQQYDISELIKISDDLVLLTEVIEKMYNFYFFSGEAQPSADLHYVS